jgi:hypothetical protein
VTDHLDDDTFERFAMRELEPAARDAALAHVVDCPRCAAIHKALLAVETEARAAKLPGVPEAPARRKRWVWAGVGALVAAAAVFAIWLVRRPDEPGVVRGGAEGLQLVAPAGDVRAPVELSWKPIRATSYRVEVFDAEGKPVWSSEVAGPPVRFAGEAAAYRWKVDALDGATVIAESTLGAFRIVP